VAKQDPPKSTESLSGFPFHDLWEESAPPSERLYEHGLDRDIIDRAFERARQLGADELSLTKEQVRGILAPLKLSADSEDRLSEKLYYYAGHYYSPWFHKLFGDDPVSARRHLRSVAATAAKLQALTFEMSASVARQFNAIRLQIHSKRRGLPFMDWAELAKELADVEKAARTVAAELPVQKRGANPKTLQGRWLRHAAEAIEEAVGRRIETKTSDSAGKNFRFEGVEGETFEKYCRLVNKGLARKTLVAAVKDYHRDKGQTL